MELIITYTAYERRIIMKRKTTIAILTTSVMMLSLMGCGTTTSEVIEGSSEIPLTEALSEGSAMTSSIGTAEEESNKDLDTATISLSDDQIQYNGNVISVMDDLNALLNKLNYPSPVTYGDDDFQSFYTSKDGLITMETLKKDQFECPIDIIIDNPEINTSHDIHVGCTRDEVIAAYGEPNTEPNQVFGSDGKEITKEDRLEQFGEEDLIYDLGDYRITFFMKDGSVSRIVYINDINHDKFSWS